MFDHELHDDESSVGRPVENYVPETSKNEVLSVHPLHEAKTAEWELYERVAHGGKALVEYALRKNPRESNANFQERLQDACAFNLGKSIIEIYNFYLSQNTATRKLPMTGDAFWKMFETDVDHRGTDYENFWIQAHRFASIYGSVGILVNKPPSVGKTEVEDLESGIYPYYSLYLPHNIMNWEFLFDPQSHRYELSKLILREVDGSRTIWRKHRWERWKVEYTGHTPKAELLYWGYNILGEIPFVWLQNIHHATEYPLGVSDLADIALIVCSVVNNISCGEEVIKFAGFPMLRLPREREGDFIEYDDKQPVGVRSVLEYDPSLGDAGKPDWMPTKIKEPVEAILMWIAKKNEEILRLSHLSGMYGQQVSSHGRTTSGLALRYEFSKLQSVLMAKSASLTEAEYNACAFWLKWRGLGELIHEVSISRGNQFNLDELAVSLENAANAMAIVNSKRFRELVQERIVKNTTPDISPDDVNFIIREIQENAPEGNDPVDLPGKKGGRQTKIRTAANAAQGPDAA